MVCFFGIFSEDSYSGGSVVLLSAYGFDLRDPFLICENALTWIFSHKSKPSGIGKQLSAQNLNMASPQPPVANTNGSYLQQADPQSFQANPTAGTAPNYQTQSGAPQQASTTESVPKDEVGWYFVEQYYTTLNKTPERLHLFYNKKSSFVWGTEGELLQLATGRPAIQEKIQSYEFKDCKVRVSNVDSQASADNGIVIQVLGEMSNNGLPNRKFSQTFFLAEQPNGYYVLNDIFRYLKDDEDMEEGEDYEEGEVEDILEDPAVEAVVNEAVEIAVEELVEAIEDLSTKETVKTEIEIEDDKIKVEETVTVEPALPVAESQDVPPSVNGNVESVNGDAPATEPEANPEPEAEPEPEPEPEPQVEEPAPAAPVVEAVPTLVEEKKAAPPAVKEPERVPTPVAVPKTVPTRGPCCTSYSCSECSNPSNIYSFCPSAAASTAAATATAATSPSAPAAPTGGSQWQTADSSKRRAASSANSANPTAAQIRNVPESITQQALRDALSKFGLKRCELNRPKGFATIDFEAHSGFAAAIANPLKIGDVTLNIEERIIDPIVRVDAEDSLLAKEATKTKVVAELPEEEEEAPGEGHTKQEVVLGPAARPLALTENPLLDIAIYSEILSHTGFNSGLVCLTVK
ncbi:uncharacterized protein LAJ45_00653 [Morchella importuna]|uniref:uncharacterized protein n=1 Tax=Morchella importuna TaxID=1174673 RepID=UPI001E8E0249|nr:uncharacterized protein LAJ45_00653 [Morchella importuna]KAH8155643.1 hypothetical protein LAJ45_00653 [Morchella importuna]